MRGTAELSNLKCEKSTPKPKPYRIPDRGGLALLVTPQGGKLWRWKYRFNGVAKQMAFGKYPDVPLARARVLHAAARAQLAAGTDPMAVRAETKAEKQAENKQKKTAQLTFKDLYELWFATWEKGKKEDTTVLNVRSWLENGPVKAFGSKSVAAIMPADLLALTRATDERGAGTVAKRNFQYIRRIYKWGKANHYLDKGIVNPAADIDIKDILSAHTGQNFAHVQVSELPGLLQKIREYNGREIIRIALELNGLTFVRINELLKARWEQIDWENSAWCIPVKNMKMKKPHVVPLSRQAMALLARLKQISGETGRLFPICNGGLGTMSDAAVLRAYARMGYEGRMTNHGWRYIASTYLRSQHYDKFWVEMQLSHVEGGVAGVYNEWECFEERTEMMQHWADFLDECREKPTIVSAAA
jgi:integrase